MMMTGKILPLKELHILRCKVSKHTLDQEMEAFRQLQ